MTRPAYRPVDPFDARMWMTYGGENNSGELTPRPALAEVALWMSQRFGRYEIERELGRRASGIVHLASDKALNRQVALKVLTLPQSIQGVERTQALERFVREARAAAAISHPVGAADSRRRQYGREVLYRDGVLSWHQPA